MQFPIISSLHHGSKLISSPKSLPGRKPLSAPFQEENSKPSVCFHDEITTSNEMRNLFGNREPVNSLLKGKSDTSLNRYLDLLEYLIDEHGWRGVPKLEGLVFEGSVYPDSNQQILANIWVNEIDLPEKHAVESGTRSTKSHTIKFVITSDSELKISVQENPDLAKFLQLKA